MSSEISGGKTEMPFFPEKHKIMQIRNNETKVEAKLFKKKKL